jgi:hypothetical protein
MQLPVGSPDGARAHRAQGVLLDPMPTRGNISLAETTLSQRWTSGNASALPLAVPRRGHVLSTTAEAFGQPIRQAVRRLADALPSKSAETYIGLFGARPASFDGRIVRTLPELAAWSIVATWVTGVAIGAMAPDTSLSAAEQWFFGHQGLSGFLNDQTLVEAELTLRSNANARAYLELLPYILDPHGPGSRLSVRRDPQTGTARARKRAEGVFYTPADVAEYMAGACLDSLETTRPPTVFDPACGTGVFLRAALKQLRALYRREDAFSLASMCLFGADIDPWPLDAAAFVLLADTWPCTERNTPAKAWRRLRDNLSCKDTLCLDHAGQRSSGSRFSITDVFPNLKRGPAVILGNPPYANLGHRSDFAELRGTLKTIAAKPSSNAELYLSFIEQMIRLADGGSCAGALVLPLSIACNVGHQFMAARDIIARTPGQWRFAFFDREPHALFGEDVKTRNAILLWQRQAADKATLIGTGPLRKWRGENRAAMFGSLRFTPLDDSIHMGIAKIEGQHQADALRTLRLRAPKLSQAVHGIERLSLNSALNVNDKTVLVGPTAYNFLNVFLKPPTNALRSDQIPSEHPLHAVRCASPADAFAVFAILSSHLAYWWWHAHGDGFHVARRFIADLPFGFNVLGGSSGETLCQYGNELWTIIKSRPVVSLNSGRTSLAYTPNGHDRIRRRVDEALAGIAGLPTSFIDEVQQFTARSISATLHEATNTLMERT